MSPAKRDLLLILGAAVTIEALFLTAWAAFAETGLIVAAGLSITVILALQLVTYRRLQASLEESNREPTENYRQIESLFSLFASLRIEQPLPAMRRAAV